MSKQTNEPAPLIVWFRQDLRLADHPALYEASRLKRPLIPLFILPDRSSESFPGAASRWWLHRSLQALIKQLHTRRQQLILKQGDSLSVIRELIEETGATSIFWNRHYDPASQKTEEQLLTELPDEGIDCQSFAANLLVEPNDLLTKNDEPYQVYTPFWKACLRQLDFDQPWPDPEPLTLPDAFPESLELDDLKLDPAINWAGGLEETWEPGSQAANEMLESFLSEAVQIYKRDRNAPGIKGTSRLSPYLHFGEISPRQIYWRTREVIADFDEQNNHSAVENAQHFLSEVGWREFCHYVLFHFPHTVTDPLRESFRDFDWAEDDKWLRAWQDGQTGFPIVDAGMRELWHIGWMHNRVRMIVASFLTKDLQIHWKEGADWFMETLVDADLANNTFGWQWTAGCGADAAPYFRIFNPTLQSEKFDPHGHYLRRWCPELAELPDKWIHKPHEAPDGILEKAGVRLGENYPEPIVDHKERRKLALEKWERVK